MRLQERVRTFRRLRALKHILRRPCTRCLDVASLIPRRRSWARATLYGGESFPNVFVSTAWRGQLLARVVTFACGVHFQTNMELLRQAWLHLDMVFGLFAFLVYSLECVCAESLPCCVIMSPY